MQVSTPFGWSDPSISQCIRVNSNGLESAEFLQCQKLAPTVPNPTEQQCRSILPGSVPRSININSPVIAGPGSAGIKLPMSVPSGVDKIRVSLYRMVGITAIPIGSEEYPIMGNLGQQVLFANMYITDDGVSGYQYFEKNIGLVATRTYQVRQKVHNACGWTSDTQTPIGYFKITDACKLVMPNFRTVNNSSKTEETEGITTADANTISIYPNPTTGNISLVTNNDYPTARLDIIDVTGKIVQTPFIEERIFAGSAIELNITDFTTGIYFYRLTSTDAVLTGKIIKQ
jgi:hypothetical protein